MNRTLAALAAVISSSVLLGLVAGSFRLTASWVWLVAVVITLAAPIAWKLAAGRIDVFEPIYLFTAGWAAMFVARPAAMLATNSLEFARPTRIIDVRDSFDRMLALAFLGAASFALGYLTPLGRRLAATGPHPPPAVYSRGTVVVLSLALAAIGIVLFAIFAYSTVGPQGIGELLQGRSYARTVALRSTTTYLSNGPMLLVPATLALFVVARDRWDVLLATLTGFIWLLLLALTLPVGARTTLLPMFLSVLIYFYLSRDKRPGSLTIGLVLLVALLGSSVLLTTRSVRYERPSVLVSVLELTRDPMILFEPITKGADAEMAPALAAALKYTPGDIHYMYGKAVIGDLLVRPIPRIIWNGKPLPPREQVISTLFPAEYASHLANPEFSILLVLFLDAGVIGVMAGMVAFGALARTIYEYMVINKDSTLVRASYALILPFMIAGVRDSPVDTMVRMAMVVLPLVLIFLASGSWSGRGRNHGARVRSGRSPESLNPLPSK